MSNTLKESMIETIQELGRRGWSIRRIAKELEVNRRTVRKYLGQDSKCTISTTGSDCDEKPKCAISTAGRKSLCGKHDEYIREQLKVGLGAQRIFQDLVEDKDFAGSYESGKRYVRKLEQIEPVPFRRMEVMPGTECQVDYGTGARVVGEDGKRRKTHLLRIVLSCSRKAYSEVSFTQETECFLRAMENAFRHFGGVPATVVIDNLKAGVLKPCVYDPELNPKLRDFAKHYGTCILPARVRTPEHKGKVERQVGCLRRKSRIWIRCRRICSLPSGRGAEWYIMMAMWMWRGPIIRSRPNIPTARSGFDMTAACPSRTDAKSPSASPANPTPNNNAFTPSSTYWKRAFPSHKTEVNP